MAPHKQGPNLDVSHLARRDFLKLAGFGTGAALLSACSSLSRLLDS
jgi:hypothetical protein